MSECWTKILASLSTMVGPVDFRVWLAPISAEISDRTLHLSIEGASSYMLHRLEQKMGRMIRTVASGELNCRPEDLTLDISATPLAKGPAAQPAQAAQPVRKAQAAEPAPAAATPNRPQAQARPAEDGMVPGPLTGLLTQEMVHQRKAPEPAPAAREQAQGEQGGHKAARGKARGHQAAKDTAQHRPMQPGRLVDEPAERLIREPAHQQPPVREAAAQPQQQPLVRETAAQPSPAAETAPQQQPQPSPAAETAPQQHQSPLTAEVRQPLLIGRPVQDVPGAAASLVTRDADSSHNGWTMAPQPLVRSLPLDQAATISGGALLRKHWRYTFDDFVVGPTNAMAMTAAQDMCRPHSYVETLFVSSEPGLGKTHIVQSAVRQLLEERGNNAKVAYLTADDFYARFRMGLRNDTLEDFMGRVRALDFLLVDDVQFLHGKARTQEVLLSLVKHLQDRGSRVVFTSRFLPKELKTLDPQLVSLLSSGILANMDAPTYGMRCEIIRRKALSQQARLPEEVVAILATNLEGDVRQIESCLQTLLLKMRVLNTGATPDMALEVVSQFSLPNKDKKALPSIDDLIDFVSKCYGVTINQLCSKIRRRTFVEARNVLFYLARKHTNMTLVEIGAKVNKRHSTVIKGIASIEHSLSSETSSGRQTARLVQLIEKNAGYVTA